MAKREISSTLRNLKFMQRAAQREEQPKKEEEVQPDGNFFSSGALNRKCVVLMEGDPHPGALRGRMSFQSFNPSIDKLNEEVSGLRKQETPASSSGNQTGSFSSRENGSSRSEAECSNIDKQDCETNGDLKRKQVEVVSEAQQHPTKFSKSVKGNQQSSSSSNNSRGFFKKPKGEKLDWRVLRPSKSPYKSG